MEQEEFMYTQEYVERTNSKAFKIVFIILGIMAFLALSSLVIYNLFPEVIPTKYMYFLAEKKTVDYFEKQIDGYNKDEFIQDQMKIYSTPYQLQSDITLNLKAGNLIGQEAQQFEMINEILKTSKITLVQNEDVKNEKARAKMSLVIKGTKLIDADMFLEKNSAGIKIPALYNKYIVLNPQDIRTACKKIGVNDVPKKLITNNDIINAIHIDKKELKNIQKDYIDFFKNNITSKDVSFSKKAEISTSEGSIKCRKITLTMNETRSKDIALKLCDKISNDERLLNLIANNVVNITKLYDDAGCFDSPGVEGIPEELKSVDAFKKKMKEDLDNSKKEITENKDKGEFIMNLFIDKNFNVLDREIKLIDKSETNSDAKNSVTTIRFAGYKNPDSKTKNYIFKIESSGVMKIELKNLQPPIVKGEAQRNNITFSIDSLLNDSEMNIVEGQIDVNIDKNTKNKQIITSTFSIEPAKASDAGFGKINGKFANIITRDPKNKTLVEDLNIDTDIKMSADFLNRSKQFGFVYNQANKTSFDVPVKMPELKKNNVLDLNKAKKKEIELAMIKIKKTANLFFAKNAHLFMGNQ